MKKQTILDKIIKAIIRQKITDRGGGFEISLDKLGWKGHKMTAYQNYLGGGMLGAIANDCTVEGWIYDTKLVEIAEEMKKYLHSLTNPPEKDGDGDKVWESVSYEQNQNMSESAY